MLAFPLGQNNAVSAPLPNENCQVKLGAQSGLGFGVTLDSRILRPLAARQYLKERW